MKGEKVLWSSESDEWETPQELFDKLHEEFHFTMDAAASYDNAKCKRFWSDSLELNWSEERAWCNPPYSKWQKFVAKAAESSNLSVLLLPARTDTKAFHAYIYNNPRV